MTEDQLSEWRVAPAEWPQAVADSAGPQLIVGGPGTGKTEFLVRRAVHLLQSETCAPQQLLLLSFSRRGVGDLRRRIEGRIVGPGQRLDITTYHSFARRLLESHAAVTGWRALPQVLTEPEHVALVARLLGSSQPDTWPVPFRPLLESRTFAREVADFILRCREQLIGPSELSERVAARAEWRGLDRFLYEYDAELRRLARIDYGTLLAEAVALLSQPEVNAATADRYRYVLVDEYQDTTVAQARMLSSLTARHRNITVAADPYQSIYSFRGADLNNVTRFPGDFAAGDGTPARRLVLTTSFRVAAVLLEAAERVTSGEIPGAAGPVVPNGEGGSVEVYRFEQETQEVEWIAAEVHRHHLEQQLPLSHMAVFVRSKRRLLPELSRALERRGIPHDRPDRRLVDQPAVRFISDCVAAATGDDGSAEADRAMRRILLGPLFRLTIAELRDLNRRRLGEEIAWPDAIDAAVSDGAELAMMLREPQWATELSASKGLWEVWSRLPQISRLVNDDSRAEERAAWGSLAQVLEQWSERNPNASLRDYRRLIEDEQFEARPLLSYQQPEADRLVLTTLHQAKGLEFEVVFVADAVEGVFPDLRSRDSVLGARHLSPNLPTDTAGYIAFRLQEERRLAYTAMTRARRRVVWTATATGFEQGRGIPSRFLALVAGTSTVERAVQRPPLSRQPISPPEAEAQLRRVLSDPFDTAPRRLAALTALVSGTRYGLRDPLEFHGMKERGGSSGLIDPKPILSPTQGEAYERCPRRYALQRRLGIGDEASRHAAFGLLIHDLLEAVEVRAQQRGAAHAKLGEALAELERQFDPSEFGGPPFAESWRRRATRALTHLYEAWPSSGQPLAAERRLGLDVAGTPWVGYADRVEGRDSSVAIVDYKTTKSNVPSVEEAAGSLQLGFYLLAASRDPDLRSHGEANEAEMWFPVKEAKKMTVRRFRTEQLASVKQRLESVTTGILREDWRAVPNDGCDRCPVRLVCPQWPEGREAFAA